MIRIKITTLTVCIVFVSAMTSISSNASAFVEGGKKKQLDACTVSSGGVVTQVGNTCSGSGDGCTANPCG